MTGGGEKLNLSVGTLNRDLPLRFIGTLTAGSKVAIRALTELYRYVCSIWFKDQRAERGAEEMQMEAFLSSSIVSH